MYRLIFSLFTAILLLGSCGDDANVQELTVASRQGDCVGVAPMKCLLIKHSAEGSWEFFYDNIEGFNYEPGYEYVIKVKTEEIENPAADQSSLKYILVKEVSKVRKTSEDLP